MTPPSPPRRALRAVLRRAERSVPAFAGLVLALGTVGAMGMAGAVFGSVTVQAVGLLAFAGAAGAALALVDSPGWLRLPVFLAFLLPSVGFAVLARPVATGTFGEPTAVVVADRLLWIPGGANCMGLYRYPAGGAIRTTLLSSCALYVPVEYVVGSPETVRPLPESRIRRWTPPPPVAE